MNFMDRRNGWHVSFLEPDSQTSLPVKLMFTIEQKTWSMQQRFGSQLLEVLQALRRGIENGRRAWLILSEKQ